MKYFLSLFILVIGCADYSVYSPTPRIYGVSAIIQYFEDNGTVSTKKAEIISIDRNCLYIKDEFEATYEQQIPITSLKKLRIPKTDLHFPQDPISSFQKYTRFPQGMPSSFKK